MRRQEEEAEFREFAARPDAIANLFSRIAPQIFGGEKIKEAVACLLFGGSRKVSNPQPGFIHFMSAINPEHSTASENIIIATPCV